MRNYAGVLIPHRLRVHLWKLSESFLFGCVVVCAIMSVGCSRLFVMLVSVVLVAITLASGVDHLTWVLIHNFFLSASFIFSENIKYHCFLRGLCDYRVNQMIGVGWAIWSEG